MARRKRRGNLLGRSISKVVHTAAPEILDTVMDAAAPPKKPSKKGQASSSGSTDWDTRVPAPSRRRRSQ